MVLLLAGPASPITVDVDLTFVVQLVLFVGFTLVLKPVLLDPMLKLFEERERATLGARAKARHIDEKSAGALAKYEGEMAKARSEASAERDRIRGEAIKREQEILAQVRADATKVIEDGKRAAQGEAIKAREALKRDASALSADVASRVLGREVHQ